MINSSLDFNDFSYNSSVSWQANSFLSINFVTAKGFRAPNLNDLGALGLNDLGFEVPAASAVAAGFIGTSDGEGAALSGKSMAALRAEKIFNYELGAAIRTHSLYVRGPFLNAGVDMIFGTSDNVFTPTNETLAGIRNRVLPVGANTNGVIVADDNMRVPLYTKTGGYAALNLRGNLRLAEKINLNLGLFNILDRNYRPHGSGTDAPGINLRIGLRFAF